MGWHEDEDYIRFDLTHCQVCTQNVCWKVDARLRKNHPEWFYTRSLQKTASWLGYNDVRPKFQQKWYDLRKKAFDKTACVCVTISISGSYDTFCRKHLREFNKLLLKHIEAQEKCLQVASTP
jgi:hypothetical protein